MSYDYIFHGPPDSTKPSGGQAASAIDVTNGKAYYLDPQSSDLEPGWLPLGSSGTTVSVNGVNVSTPNFNDTTPPSISGVNIQWQVSGSNVSANISGLFFVNSLTTAAPTLNLESGAGINVVDVGGGSVQFNFTGASWDSLLNAGANLTLNNDGFSTTFQQSSAINWTWANITAATSGVSQSSPIINLDGTYWTGAASAVDGWTIQDVIGTGTNGSSVLTIGHSGSAGSSANPIQVLVNVQAASAGNTKLPSLGVGSVTSGLWGNGSSIALVMGGNNAMWMNLSSSGTQVPSTGVYGFSSVASILTAGSDTGISRVAAGLIGVGTGASGSIAGGIRLKSIDVQDTAANTDVTVENTTAATSGVSQSSPIITINGTYWTGAASAVDSWTVQDVVANGTNGAVNLKFTHAGSTGLASVQFSGANGFMQWNDQTAPSTTNPTVQFAGPVSFRNTVLSLQASNGQNAYAATGTAILSSLSNANNFNFQAGQFIFYSTTGNIGLTSTGSTLHTQWGATSIIRCNNEAAAGIGIPFFRGTTSQKAETGADANVLTVTPAAAVGTYRITLAMAVSAATAATLGWTATWTDSNGTAQAPTNLALFTSGTAAPSLTVAAAANGNYYAEAIVDVNNAGTAIVVKTTFAGTSIAYKVTATIERIA